MLRNPLHFLERPRRAVRLGLLLGISSVLVSILGAPGSSTEEKRFSRATGRGNTVPDPQFLLEVKKAVSRGAAWIESQQRPDGSFGETYAKSYPLGETGLACLTLSACGVSATSPSLDRGLPYLRQTYDSIRKRGGLGLTTYGVSLALMAVVEAHRELTAPPPSGSRDFSSRSPAAPARTSPAIQLSVGHREWIAEMTRWLVRQRNRPSGLWRYPRPSREYDHSNTQFAILALRSARYSGVDVPTRVFYEVLQHFLSVQETGTGAASSDSKRGTSPGRRPFSRNRKRQAGESEDGPIEPDPQGGFGYLAGRPPTGSMTAAGIVCLSVCREQVFGRHPDYDLDLDAKVDESIESGLEWLGRHFSVDRAPDPAGEVSAEDADLYRYYFLYTLERACGVAQVSSLGGHDWYRDGARALLSLQGEEGCWRSSSERSSPPSLIHTCFALLFLSRLSDPTARLITPAPRLDFANATKLGDADFDALFERVFSERLRNGAERGPSVDQFRALGSRVYSRLVDRLASSLAEERQASFDVLHGLTGATLDYRWNAPVKERRQSIRKWRDYVELLY